MQDSIFDGKVVMDTVVNETFVGMANGLPRTAFGQGSQPIDFNKREFDIRANIFF